MIKLYRICTDKPFGLPYINAAANNKTDMLFDPMQTILAPKTTREEYNYLKLIIQLILTSAKLTVRKWLFLTLLAGTAL